MDEGDLDLFVRMLLETDEIAFSDLIMSLPVFQDEGAAPTADE